MCKKAWTTVDTVLIWSVITFVLMTITAMCTQKLCADESFTLRKFDFELGKYTGGDYDGFILDTLPTERLDVRPVIRFDIDLYCTSLDEFCVYFNNEITGKSTNVQYRYVNWIIDGGFSFKNIDFFYQHESQHLLENEGHGGHRGYPNENWAGIRLKFVNNPRKVE